MGTVRLEQENIIVGDYKNSNTREAGICLVGSKDDVVIVARNKEMLDHVIAGLERAKIEIDRMNARHIADEPVEVKYHDTLSN